MVTTGGGYNWRWLQLEGVTTGGDYNWRGLQLEGLQLEGVIIGVAVT